MTAEPNAPETSLPESDYLALLDVILKLHDCDTQDSLKQTVGSQILPLFQSQRCSYGWSDPEISSVQLNDQIGYDGIPLDFIERLIPYDPLVHYQVKSDRSVVAYGVDINRGLADVYEIAYQNFPEFTSFIDKLSSNKSALLALAMPEREIGFHLARETELPFTRRDVRMMELLRPHLMRVIKSVMLNSELAKHISLVEALANVTTAVALVSPEMRVLFANDAFKQNVKAEEGHLLPADLSELLGTEINRIRATDPRKKSYIELPFYRINGDAHRLSLTYLKGRGVEEDRCWLIRLKPASDPYSQMHLKMQDVGLTPRETEIAVLIKDGFDDREIADRLFISAHTIGTHLKNIYRKFDVNTRPKLMAALTVPLIPEAGEEGRK